MPEPSLVETAGHIAAAAHAGQTDKLGVDYIHHPRQVERNLAHPEISRHVLASGVDIDVLRAVALLHDVIEDTDETSDSLRAAGIPDDVIRAVQVMSHPRGEPNEDYWQRVAAHLAASVCKRADVMHNADPDRLALLDEATRTRLQRKYARCLEVLDAAPTPIPARDANDRASLTDRYHAWVSSLAPTTKDL